MNEIFNAALKYHDLGFNLTYINPKKNDPLKKKIYKAPTNNRQKLKKKKQEFDELISFDWKNSSGVGTVLGYKKLRAIDIDFQSQLKLNGKSKLKDITPLVLETLEILKLPHTYEWVIKTPSNGFHIIFYCDDHKYNVWLKAISEFKEKKIKSFKPNKDTLDLFPYLGHFELR